jgi:hypothetical protein
MSASDTFLFQLIGPCQMKHAQISRGNRRSIPRLYEEIVSCTCRPQFGVPRIEIAVRSQQVVRKGVVVHVKPVIVELRQVASVPPDIASARA